MHGLRSSDRVLIPKRPNCCRKARVSHQLTTPTGDIVLLVACRRPPEWNTATAIIINSDAMAWFKIEKLFHVVFPTSAFNVGKTSRARYRYSHKRNAGRIQKPCLTRIRMGISLGSTVVTVLLVLRWFLGATKEQRVVFAFPVFFFFRRDVGAFVYPVFFFSFSTDKLLWQLLKFLVHFSGIRTRNASKKSNTDATFTVGSTCIFFPEITGLSKKKIHGCKRITQGRARSRTRLRIVVPVILSVVQAYPEALRVSHESCVSALPVLSMGLGQVTTNKRPHRPKTPDKWPHVFLTPLKNYH